MKFDVGILLIFTIKIIFQRLQKMQSSNALNCAFSALTQFLWKMEAIKKWMFQAWNSNYNLQSLNFIVRIWDMDMYNITNSCKNRL
jgi:hypothetical protein